MTEIVKRSQVWQHCCDPALERKRQEDQPQVRAAWDFDSQILSVSEEYKTLKTVPVYFQIFWHLATPQHHTQKHLF